MSTPTGVAVLALLWAAPALAQGLTPDLKEAVLRVQPSQFEDPACGIKPKHFRVKGAAVYIQTAMENSSNRSRLLRDSRNAVIEAITENDQGENPGAWYILGRVYLYEADIAGADSALARVTELAPECTAEINTLRHNTWVAIRNYALAQEQRSQTDSALASYRIALTIYGGEADVFYVMASLQERAKQADSTAWYLRRTLEVEDTSETGLRMKHNVILRLARNYSRAGEVDSAVAYYRIIARDAEAEGDTVQVESAEAQIAGLYFRAKRFPEALVAFRAIEARDPSDATATRNIATVFQAMGQMDSAQAVMAKLGGAAAAAMDTTSSRFLINRGASRYAANNFTGAAADFQRALKSEPSNRLAMINLGLAYNKLKDGPKLVAAAQQAIDREPLHELSYRLLLQGYIYEENEAKARATVSRLDALPITVDSLQVQDSPGLMTITGVAQARDRPAGPVHLTFDFLGADGGVITSVEVTVPALSPKATSSFVAQGNADDIVNWRYRINR